MTAMAAMKATKAMKATLLGACVMMIGHLRSHTIVFYKLGCSDEFGPHYPINKNNKNNKNKNKNNNNGFTEFAKLQYFWGIQAS